MSSMGLTNAERQRRFSFLRAKPLLFCYLRSARASWPRCDPLSRFLDLETSGNTHRDFAVSDSSAPIRPALLPLICSCPAAGGGSTERRGSAASPGWPQSLPILMSPRITLATLVDTRALRAVAASRGNNGGGTTAGAEAATRPRRRGAPQADAGRPQSSTAGGRALATSAAGPVAGRRRRAADAQAARAVGGTPLRCVAETSRAELEAGRWTSTAGTKTLRAATSLQPPPGGGGHRKTRDAGDGVAVRGRPTVGAKPEVLTLMTSEQGDGWIPAPDDAEPARGKMLELGLGAVEAPRDPLGILQLQETERTDVFGIPHAAESGDRDQEAPGRRSRGASLPRGEAACDGTEERRPSLPSCAVPLRRAPARHRRLRRRSSAEAVRRRLSALHSAGSRSAGAAGAGDDVR